MLSEVHSSSSPSLNTKSKLQTCGYQTAGGSGVVGCGWVAEQGGSKVEAEAGAMWKWELHTGSEMEATVGLA